MKCPYCEKELYEFDEPDEATRCYCSSCKIMVTIHDIDEEDLKEICGEDYEDCDELYQKYSY